MSDPSRHDHAATTDATISSDEKNKKAKEAEAIAEANEAALDRVMQNQELADIITVESVAPEQSYPATTQTTSSVTQAADSATRQDTNGEKTRFGLGSLFRDTFKDRLGKGGSKASIDSSLG